MHLRSCVLVLSVITLSLFIPLAASADGPVHKWSKQFGGPNRQQPIDMALDPDGNIVFAGFFNVAIDLGGGPLTAVNGGDAFLAKLTDSGGHVWSKRFGEIGETFAGALAVNATGDIVLVGSFTGTADFGGGLLTATDSDVFVAKFDEDGNHLWSARFGSAGRQGAWSAAFDSDGNMLIAGWTLEGSVDFGGGPLVTTDYDSWVVKFDPSGVHQWSRLIGDVSTDPADALPQVITTVAADPLSGDVLIVGSFNGTADFGAGPVTPVYQDMFITRYDASGTYVRNQVFPSAQLGEVVNGDAMAIDAAGNVTVGGVNDGVVDFGGGPLPYSHSIFLASFDVSGAHRWSQNFQRRMTDDDVYWGDASIWSIGVGPGGEISFSGNFADSLMLGGDWMSNNLGGSGIGEIYVAKFDVNGAHTWSKEFGRGNGLSTVVDNAGDVYATGYMSGPMSFGGDTFTPQELDGFLVRFGDGPLLPVLITRFDARPGDAGVTLRWELWSDEDIESFALLRSEGTAAPIAIAEIADTRARSFVDKTVEPGRSYRYELAVYTKDGDVYRSPPATATSAMPGLALGENRPNPFNPRTTIPYRLPEKAQHVEMRIVDAAGRVVRTLVNEDQPAGSHTVDWNGRDDNGQTVASGVYFCVLKAGKQQLSRKMVVLK